MASKKSMSSSQLQGKATRPVHRGDEQLGTIHPVLRGVRHTTQWVGLKLILVLRRFLWKQGNGVLGGAVSTVLITVLINLLTLG